MLKKKIIIFTDSIARGGKERQIFIIASSLKNMLFDVKVATSEYSESNYLDEYNCTYEILEILDKSKFQQLKKISKILSMNRGSIALTFDTMNSFFVLLLYKIYAIKFYNCSVRHGIRLRKFSHYFRMWVCWLSPYVIANSATGLKANQMSVGPTRFVLFNGNPLIGTFKASNMNKEMNRRFLLNKTISSDTLIIISVANFVPYKDYFTVLKALSSLVDKRKFIYIIIGDGLLRNEIERVISELMLNEHVLLLGKKNNVFDYLLISDIFLHSSRGEGISNAILEAMIAGLPIIATDVGGTKELINPLFSRTFKYNSVTELTTILINEIDEIILKTADKTVFRDTLEKFSLENMNNTLIDILSK